MAVLKITNSKRVSMLELSLSVVAEEFVATTSMFEKKVEQCCYLN